MKISKYNTAVRDRAPASASAKGRTVVCALGMLLLLAIPVSGAPTARKVAKFQIKLLDGKAFTNKDLQGKVAVIDVWATWCKPCVAEVPDYNAFYRDYKSKGIVFLALATESGTVEDIREAAKRFKMEYPVGVPSLKDLDSFGEVIVLPTTYVIDKSGTIVKEILGVPQTKHKTIRTLVDSLLRQ